MGRLKPQKLKGFRDFPPRLMAAREHVGEVAREEAGRAGFQPISTPALEYATTLLGSGGEETDKQVYRFRDHGDRDVAMRFDLTVPFARFVAEHQGELNFPFKRFQVGDVWRGENTQKGRYREFRQCDLDIIGVDTAAADVEILAVFARILERLDCGPFAMAVGHRGILSALIRSLAPDVSAAGENEVLIALDKLEKIGAAKVEEALSGIEGVPADMPKRLLDVLTRRDADGNTDLSGVRELLASNDEAQQAVDRLAWSHEMLRERAGLTSGSVRIDLTIARGLGYYTGIVFETFLEERRGFGSICSGGRYDDLASRFSSRSLPGVGGSIGVDRLLAVLEDSGRLQESSLTPEVFVAVATDDAWDYGYELATTLRAAGVRCEMGLSRKIAQQMKHADRLGAPYVVVVGSDEKTAGTYRRKNMRDGTEERDLPRDGLVSFFKN